MVSSIGDVLAVDRGALLRMPEIMARTGMKEGTVRSRYHAGTFDVLWRLGRYLVVWERDLDEWLDRQREATRKTLADTNWAGPFGDILAALPDIELAQRALVREKTIRRVMEESGESREIVIEAVDAASSMDQEFVLELTEGEPTTLRDALDRLLRRYELDGNVEAEEAADTPLGRVLGELGAILAYPYPGREGAPLLEFEGEDGTMGIVVRGVTVFTANYDEHGSAGMDAARRAAEGVYRALTE